MKKLIFSLFTILFPVLLCGADDSGSSMSLRPPTTDVSVIFLSNIFGVVDGVLHGTGSQIMGAMFAVFNSAVLALGGIIIMYTLMVSTVNTAQEGQMLGQKWSSIWVPVRSTLGLTLLIPKASGYCIMQIMFMWVVVQGVGAADRVWEAALNYLNRGGVIVQQQINPIAMVAGPGQAVLAGAANILYGQVCMLGIESALKAQRNSILKNDKTIGTCKKMGFETFCKTPIPNFLDTVRPLDHEDKILKAEAVAIADAPPGTKPGKVTTFWEPMPDFSDEKFKDSPYHFLEGACGSITWNRLEIPETAITRQVGADGMQTASKARATGLQQMYLNLVSVADKIVNNNPLLGETPKTVIKDPAAPWATDQFGVPTDISGSTCSQGKLNNTPGCVNWERDGTMAAKGPLLNGTELIGALSDYNAVMLPTLTLMQQTSTGENDPRLFLNAAKTTGWMLAGSYYFKLVSLSAANTLSYSNSGDLVPNDKNSGLTGWVSGIKGKDAFNLTSIKDSFQPLCKGTYAQLCTWLIENKSDPISAMNGFLSLFQGSDSDKATAFSIPSDSPGNVNNQPEISVVSGMKSSTVFGFVNNSLMMTLPGQAGTQAPRFAMDLAPNFTIKTFELPEADLPCDGFMCVPSAVAETIYNYVLRFMFQTLITAVMTVMNTVLMMFLTLPLLGMGEIFKACVAVLQNPDANPIVALATMGINYINFASDLWMVLLVLAVTQMMIPLVGPFIIALLMMAMPLLVAWLGVMVAIGYLTAYYIPFLPYMIFTFASIAWLMAVIEAMVAAPIVALSITHPEGEGPFGGKAEQALMILMNVFLRPALMIIGYISAIILSYVSIWVINAGFSNVLPFMQGRDSWQGATAEDGLAFAKGLGQMAAFAVGGPVVGAVAAGGIGAAGGKAAKVAPPPSDTAKANYTGWAGIYGFFFAILIYTTMYLTVVQKAFSLIGILPDKVLRWIGAQQESVGQESAQWAEDTKKQVGDAGKETYKAGQQIGKDAVQKGGGLAEKAKKKAAGGTAGME